MLLNKETKQILDILHNNNYEAYLVGGCVRDYLLNIDINDYDITTNATPDELVTIAKNNNINVILTGIKHGTVTYVLNHEHVEITTYRYDGEYTDNRHPKQVTFTKNLKDDVARRDFTINSICYDGKEFIDYYDGKKDLDNKLIKAIGDPDLRFNEDALRILRAIRFSFSLNFEIEENTLKSIKNNAHLLNNISKERIRDELIKILNTNAKDILIKLREYNVLDKIIKEYPIIYDIPQETPYHIYDVFNHTNVALNSTIGYDTDIRLAIMLHDLGKAYHKSYGENGVCHFYGHAFTSSIMAKSILQSLKFPNAMIKEIVTIIEYHDYRLNDNMNKVRKFIYNLNGDFDLAIKIMEIQIFDNLGKNPAIIEEKNQLIYDAVAKIKEVQYNHECVTIKDLKINGQDLLDNNYHNEEIGKALKYLLRHVLNQQDKNNREYLLNYIRRRKNEILSSK